MYREKFLKKKNFVSKNRPPQIALSARLSSRHIVPKFENILKMAGTFRKRPLKAVIWQALNQFVGVCTTDPS